MKRLLAIITCFSGLCLTGCSIPEWSVVHRIDVQQGNVITQDVINQLEPGMSRRQVQFVAGSPMVADVFHQDRWDYLYHLKPGKGEVTSEHVSLFFEEDALVRISGTLHPQDEDKIDISTNKQVTLIVPPQERVAPGVLSRLWRWITFREAEEELP